MNLDRREFLMFSAAAATLLPGARRLIGQDTSARKGNPVLVVIYQRGGMDAVNAIAPFGDKRYYEIRPTIALPPKDGDDGPGVVPLDDMFGLHPSLKPLKPLYDRKAFAPVISVGSPHETRSHFDAQDFMEYAAPGSRTTRMGWLNRYLNASKPKDAPPLRAVAMQGLLPRALRGEVPVLAVPDPKVLKNDKVLGTFEDIYGAGSAMGEKRGDDPVVAAGQETLETLKRYREMVEKRTPDRKAKYPSGRFAEKMRDIASLIHADAGLEVACVDYGGWDHHANEGGNDGELARLLKDVGETLAAFAEDLGDKFSRTLVVTMTEFGRTCRENGNRGTDHGHGGVMLLLGGAVKGGKVHGKWQGLEDKALYQSRDLAVTTDFRDVFAEVLRSHMNYETPKGFFPDFKPAGVKGLF